jgi:hypothetical protein
VAGVGAARSTVPIRTFELPTETLGTLRAKIELQKQAMRATSAKAGNLLSSRNPTTSSATGFYPLSDGMQIDTYRPIYTCVCHYNIIMWFPPSDPYTYMCTCSGLQTLPLYGNYQVVYIMLGKVHIG